MKNSIYIFISFLFLLLSSCTQKVTTADVGIDPQSEENLLNTAFVIDGKLKRGAIPQANSNNGTSPSISGLPTAIEISAGVILQIPFNASATSGGDICKIYLQVNGANAFWEIPYKWKSSNAVLEIFIPIYVKSGNYDLTISVEDCNGNISDVNTVNTLLNAIGDCNSLIEGTYGITIRSFDFGDKEGEVTILYDTYTIPDRIDIRQQTEWKASTGTLFQPNEFPNCAMMMNGIVSGQGLLQFYYDPKKGRNISVYVTGCDPLTAWDVQLSCPQ